MEPALRMQWPGPPVVKADPMELEKRGRGTSHTVATTKPCPNKKLPSGAPKTRAIRFMDAVKGALKQVLRYVRAQEQAGLTRVGGWPRGVEQCWLSAHRGMDQLQQERPPPPLEGIVVPSRDRLCDARTLEQLMAALEAAVRARALAEERARVQAWRQWIDESWATSPGVVYRWIRGAGDAALQMVRTPSGEFTAKIAEMDEAIRAAWAPVNRRYEANSEPSVDKFMQDYRHHVRHSAMKARMLMGDVLLQRARKMGVKTAYGLHLWSISLLKRLARQGGRRLHVARAQRRRGGRPHEAAAPDSSLANLPYMGRGQNGRRTAMAGAVDTPRGVRIPPPPGGHRRGDGPHSFGGVGTDAQDATGGSRH